MFSVDDLHQYFEDSKSTSIGFQGTCHDCGGPVTIDVDLGEDGKVTIAGGAMYKPQTGPTPADTTWFLKCDKCYKERPAVTNYRPCDVYSRVIGYLSPVGNWNEGKQEEWKHRKTFKGVQ